MVNRCPFFVVDDLRLVEVWNDDTSATGSFHLLSAINRPVAVARADGAGEPVELVAGETVLVPACYGAYTVTPLAEGECTVVRTTL